MSAVQPITIPIQTECRFVILTTKLLPSPLDIFSLFESSSLFIECNIIIIVSMLAAICLNPKSLTHFSLQNDF